MDWKRVLRIVVCLVLVFSLFVGISPIRSNAYLLPGFSDDVICTVILLSFLAANGFVISTANLDFNLQFCEDVSDSFDYFLEEQLDYGGFIDTDGDGDPDDDDERDPTDDEILEAVNKLKSDKTKYQELLNQVGAPPRWTDLDYTIAQWGSGLFNAYTEFIRFCAERGYFGMHPDNEEETVETPWVEELSVYVSYINTTRKISVSPSYSDNSFYYKPAILKYSWVTDDGDIYYHSGVYSIGFQPYCYRNGKSASSSFKFGDYYFHYFSDTGGYSADLLTAYDDIDGLHFGPYHFESASSCDSFFYDTFDPFSSPEYIVEPTAIVPDSAAASIVAGGVVSAADIFLPEGLDLTSIFEGVSAGDYAALQSNLVASAEGLANGSVTINNYQRSITYNYDTSSDDEDDSTDASDPTGGSGDNENAGSDSGDSENNGSDSSDSEQEPVEGTFANFPVLDFFSRLGQLLQDIFDGNLLGVREFFEPLLSGIRDDLSYIDTSVQDGFDDVVDINQDINDSVKDIFDQNQEMQDSVKDEFQNQNEIIAQESQSLSDRLLNGLQSLFIPSEGFVDKKVDDLRKNYAFADSIAMTAKDLETFLTSLGSVPPVIRINLGSATTSYNLGGDMVFVDFSFYEPYKASMDAVLSAFLWLWFCWRVILNLPGIIGGVSGFIGAFTDSRHVGSDPVPASSWQMPFGSSHGVVSFENRASPQFQPGGYHHYTEWVRSRNDSNYKAFHKK